MKQLIALLIICPIGAITFINQDSPVKMFIVFILTILVSGCVIDYLEKGSKNEKRH